MFSLDSGVALWIAVALISAIIEISIPQFGMIFVSVAAVVAAGASAFGAGLAVQILLFVIALGLSLTLIRPRVLARIDGPGVPSRTQGLIGRDGVVTHDIDATVGAGRVNVGGEDWAARAAAPLVAGTRIRVVSADGIVLEVTSV